MTEIRLIENYLYLLTYGKIMNVNPCFMRFFPLLLGGHKVRMKLSAPFMSSCFTSYSSTSTSKPLSSIQNSIKENPYYEKYAEKIKKLKLSDPIEYEKRIKQLESTYSFQPVHNVSSTSNLDSGTEKKIEPKSSSTMNEKNLDFILNIEKIQTLSAEKIKNLWIEYYANKDAVCAVIPSRTYRNIHSLAITYPVFVYPIPRQNGFEMFVGQFASDDFHFTSLFNYQRHQANAPSQLTLNHYVDLETTKGVVLMSGIVHDKDLSVTDAQLLSYLIQHFHIEHPSLVKKFNLSPSTFNFEDVISAVDKTLLANNTKSTTITN